MNRVSTGIAGLDPTLGGGLQEGAVVMLAGAPGTGKTILAQQLCFAAATAEHHCIYYTTVSEPHDKLVRHLEAFSFFDPQALGPLVEHIHLGDLLNPGGEEGLRPLVSEVLRKTMAAEPAIVVIDGVKMLRDFADERELRRALYELTGRFSHTRSVLLLLGEYTPEELGSGIEFSLADGIIYLEYQHREPVDRRCLRVLKLRGASPLPGNQTFRIGPAGVEVFPRIETLEPAAVRPVSGRMPSGVSGLDEMMSGGMRVGDASLVTGPSGVGKTIFGLCWSAEGLRQGERCLYVTFQDTADQLAAMANTFGWDFAGACAAGDLVISHVPMGDLDLDVLASTVRSDLAGRQVSRIVVDSLAELVFAAREWERFPAYLRSLVGFIRAAGSSLLVTSETAAHDLVAQSLEGLMFLFDNVVDLRYIEQESEVGRALNVVKMRSSQHRMTLNDFKITDRGPAVGDTLIGVTGRLGWSALRTQAPPARTGDSR